MPVFVSPEGHFTVWEEKPEGYFTVEEWESMHPFEEPESHPYIFTPGSDYEKRGDNWWQIRFTRKEFLLHCGIQQVILFNTRVIEGNAIAKTVHDLLFASEYIDVNDSDTINLVNLLTTEVGGEVLTAEDATRILQGAKYVDGTEAEA